MRLLVTGKSGQLATALLEMGATRGVDIVTVGRPEFDLADPGADLAPLTRARPDAIISAAAYTAVDKAEAEAPVAEQINAAAPALLARFAADRGIPIVHLSTDYVFDGTKPTPYVETDPTHPLGVYGATKLGGEQAVASVNPNHAILRTAWVYSPFGNNFLRTMLRLAQTRSVLSVVADQQGNPTSALDLADAVISVAKSLLASPDDPTLRGIFHVAGSGSASWADFATEIFRLSAGQGGPSASVLPIPSTQYPTPARRPANSRLATNKLAQAYGVTLSSWQESTAATVKRLLAEQTSN